MITILRAIQAGEMPPMSIVVAVQQALDRSADLYRPASQDLKSVLRQASDLDVRPVHITSSTVCV